MNTKRSGFAARMAGLFLVAGTVLGAANATTAMDLVRDGKPLATIIISATAPDPVKQAVNDLQRCIEKMSGAKLPIETSPDKAGNLILVGRMPAVDALIPDLDSYDLGHDGVVLKTFPRKLVITGKSDGYRNKYGSLLDCGTPNAVYYFLESLGCRWYMPDADGEVIPRKATISVSATDVIIKPSFRSRLVQDAHWTGAMSEKVQAEALLWQVRNRAAPNTYHQGHSIQPQFLNPAVYFAQHPEWYPLINGQRYPGPQRAQACFSNPEVVEFISQSLITLLNTQGPWWSYPVSPTDGGNWCECAKCRAADGDKEFIYDAFEAPILGQFPDVKLPNTANGYLKFLNAVAEKVETTHPECLIAYYALYNLPGFPEVKPRDNVLPYMCHILPNHYFWRREVAKWEAISKQLFYLTYVGYQYARPRLTIGDEIRWCHAHKGIGVYLEVHEYSPIARLSEWLAAQTMWDVTTDSKKALAEFYKNYYGTAERPMRLFYETFEAATWQGSFPNSSDCLYAYPDYSQSDLEGDYPYKWVAKCRGHTTEALSVAREPVVRRRIESVSRYWRATELHVLAQQAMDQWKVQKTDRNRESARGAVKIAADYVNSIAGEFYFYRGNPSTYNFWLGELDKG